MLAPQAPTFSDLGQHQWSRILALVGFLLSLPAFLFWLGAALSLLWTGGVMYFIPRGVFVPLIFLALPASGFFPGLYALRWNRHSVLNPAVTALSASLSLLAVLAHSFLTG